MELERERPESDRPTRTHSIEIMITESCCTLSRYSCVLDMLTLHHSFLQAQDSMRSLIIKPLVCFNTTPQSTPASASSLSAIDNQYRKAVASLQRQHQQLTTSIALSTLNSRTPSTASSASYNTPLSQRSSESSSSSSSNSTPEALCRYRLVPFSEYGDVLYVDIEERDNLLDQAPYTDARRWRVSLQPLDVSFAVYSKRSDVKISNVLLSPALFKYLHTHWLQYWPCYSVAAVGLRTDRTNGRAEVANKIRKRLDDVRGNSGRLPRIDEYVARTTAMNEQMVMRLSDDAMRLIGRKRVRDSDGVGEECVDSGSSSAHPNSVADAYNKCLVLKTCSWFSVCAECGCCYGRGYATSRRLSVLRRLLLVVARVCHSVPRLFPT